MFLDGRGREYLSTYDLWLELILPSNGTGYRIIIMLVTIGIANVFRNPVIATMAFRQIQQIRHENRTNVIEARRNAQIQVMECLLDGIEI